MSWENVIYNCKNCDSSFELSLSICKIVYVQLHDII